MKKLLFILVLVSGVVVGCDSVKSKAKETIKDVGEGVGAGVSELGKGIKEGVDESFTNELSVHDNLKDAGIEFGKVISENESFDVYVIFHQDYSDTLIAKVFDKNGQEIGRSKVLVEGKKDDANYVTVDFEHPTNIDFDSKLTIEKRS